MDRSTNASNMRALWLQIGAVATGLAALYLMPPERGRVLLVPLTTASHLSLVRSAIDAGAALVAVGPFPATLVVQNDSPGFARRMIMAGVLPVAASAAIHTQIVHTICSGHNAHTT